MRIIRPCVFGSLLCVFVLAGLCRAQVAPGEMPSGEELKRLSLEELMQLEVTSVSRHAVSLFETPASVTVITQEMIQRSGVTTLPEALRLATNLGTAQVDSRQWAITARGFNGTVANKLLVLIDGRSVYTPLYSGVFWDVQNVFLPDIERIEVVSGPGGILWGANAVNGVINIITKNSADRASQGPRLYGGAGTTDRAFGGVRYGGHLGAAASYRVYGMYFEKDHSRLPAGGDAQDEWKTGQGGFRLDWNPDQANSLAISGDLYGGSFTTPSPDRTTADGANILARWTRHIDEHSSIEAVAYADHTYRNIPGTFAEDLETYDIDVQHRFGLGEAHEVTLGGGFRYYVDAVENSPLLAFLPSRLNLRLYNGFVQDRIALIANTLTLTLGSKLEHNDFTGLEVQPGVRCAWLFAPRQLLWGAVSRSVRTPSRIDRDFFIPGVPPYSVLAGGPGFESEKLVAYELGYRFASASMTLDVAAFHNQYDDLRSLEPGPPPVLANGLEGTTHGVEIEILLQPLDWWRLRTGYRFLQKYIDLKPWSMDVNNGDAEGNDARHRLKILSLMQLGESVEFDAGLRAVSRLPNPAGRVPGYVSLDSRLGFRPSDGLTLSLVGQNLLRERHPEFGAPATRFELERSVMGRIDWGL